MLYWDGKWGDACFNEAENRLHAQKGVHGPVLCRDGESQVVNRL